jgi:hypothetical protein
MTRSRTPALPPVLLVALLAGAGSPLVAQTPPTQAAPAAPAPASDYIAATPENAAAFLGAWTLSGTGQNGPATFTLTVKTDAGKVVGEISGDAIGQAPMTDISMFGASLVLSFSFDYQGSQVATVITLTPADGKIGMVMDFAGGAYVMEGTAAKAEAPRSN